jgi:hypothetical protein
MGKIIRERLLLTWNYVDKQIKKEKKGKGTDFIPVNNRDLKQYYP